MLLHLLVLCTLHVLFSMVCVFVRVWEWNGCMHHRYILYSRRRICLFCLSFFFFWFHFWPTASRRTRFSIWWLLPSIGHFLMIFNFSWPRMRMTSVVIATNIWPTKCQTVKWIDIDHVNTKMYANSVQVMLCKEIPIRSRFPFLKLNFVLFLWINVHLYNLSLLFRRKINRNLDYVHCSQNVYHFQLFVISLIPNQLQYTQYKY